MNSNNNRSPPLRTGEICTISPIGVSPDEMIATPNKIVLSRPD